MIIDILSSFLAVIDNGEIIAAAVGALFGALGAFAASQYHFILAHRHGRWEEHRESLVRLELILNEFLDMAYVNIGVMSKFQKIGVIPDRKQMFWGTPSQLPIDRTFMPKLANVKLSNKLFSLYVKTRKINHDIETAFESYGTVRQALIKDEISFEQYKSTTAQLINWSKTSSSGHKLLIDMVKELIAIVKILLNKDKPHRVTSFIVKKQSYEFKPVDVEAKKKQLQEEIEKVSEASKKKVQEYLGPG